MATHDYLTELPNRILLNDRIDQYLRLAKRTKTIGVLMTLDLDGFKQINDTYGHQTGDIVLKSIAKRLTELVRETDTVARLGGDEFILLSYTSQKYQRYQESRQSYFEDCPKANCSGQTKING